MHGRADEPDRRRAAGLSLENVDNQTLLAMTARMHEVLASGYALFDERALAAQPLRLNGSDVGGPDVFDKVRERRGFTALSPPEHCQAFAAAAEGHDLTLAAAPDGRGHARRLPAADCRRVALDPAAA